MSETGPSHDNLAGGMPPVSAAPPPFPLQAPRRSTSPWVWIAVVCGGLCVCCPVLAAILFPVFAQARFAARKTVTLSDGRQAALSLLMYATDYDERLPDLAVWGNGDLLMPYVKSRKIVDEFQYAYTGPLDTTKLPHAATEMTGFIPGSVIHYEKQSVQTFANGSARWVNNPPPLMASALCRKWVTDSTDTEQDVTVRVSYARTFQTNGFESFSASLRFRPKGEKPSPDSGGLGLTIQGRRPYQLAGGVISVGQATNVVVMFTVGDVEFDKDRFDNLHASEKDPDMKAVFDMLQQTYKNEQPEVTGPGEDQIIRYSNDQLLLKTDTADHELDLYRAK